jgi:acyl dehydratase
MNDFQGRLDDRCIDALRRRIGIPRRTQRRPHNEQLTEDAFRHYAMGYGDDNPIYCEPGYGKSSRWGTVIAPPLFPLTAGRPRVVEWTTEQEAAMSGGNPLAGIGEYLCGERWIFGAALVPGAPLERTDCIDAVQLKRSEFGGGSGALVSNRVEWNSGSATAAVRLTDMWHAEKSGTRSASKNANIKLSSYEDEQLADLDRVYASEIVRGSQPRYWESVQVGDELGAVAKGPLTLTDVITYHIGVGWGAYGGGTSKIAYKNRMRVSGLYVPNNLGIADTVQRCHWEDAYAQQLGHPAAYDYGTMRTNWMVHLLTNWMGDAGWLWKLSASVTKFNYLGDAHVMTGSVTAVREHDQGEIDVRIEGRNQRGDVTCHGNATLLLPSQGQAITIPPMDLNDAPPAIEPPSTR